MDVKRKLSILADAAKYDASCASGGARRRGDGRGLGSTERAGICHSYTPDGRCVSLLKILFTNYCVYDCQYCVNRLSSDVPRAAFEVGEVVWLTLEFYRRNYIEGLFLSSGVVRGPDATMERLVAVARALRDEHGFRGYIHLKAVPGASNDLLAQAGRYADRLSANVELPTEADLAALAPQKRMGEVESAMALIRARREQAKAEAAESPKAPRFAPAGQSTQMIVGATPARDRDLLSTASSLYRRHRLRRVYYSAYSPVPSADPRLPFASPPLVREHRLYQADWLLRFYGFDVAELTPPESPDLPLDLDPKLAWALRNRALFPVDLNRAPREQLVRVPGLGVRGVERVLATRRARTLHWHDLPKLGLAYRAMRPFITCEGRAPGPAHLDRADLRRRLAPPSQQLDLFSIATSARGGEL